MNMREILDTMTVCANEKPRRSLDINQIIGDEVKNLLRHINLDRIKSADLSTHILSTIRRAYLRQGVSRSNDIADLYGKDDLDLAETLAKIGKIEAEIAKIDRS